MQRLVTYLGNILFHLVFGVAFLGGAAGVAALINFWPKREPDEGRLLVAMGILCIAVAAAGALGIVKFRDKATRTLDMETDVVPLQSMKPISNFLSGLVILLVCGLTLIYSVRKATPRNSLIHIPVVVIACGVLQFSFGAWQLASGVARRLRNK